MVEYIVYDEELPSDEKELVKVLVTDEEKTLMEKLIKRIEQLSESATFLDNHDIISKLSELENIVKKNYEKIYDENYAALDKVNTSINSSRNEFSRKLDSIKNKIDESTDTETIEMKIDKMIELMAATQEVYRILGEKNIISMQDVTEKINIMVNGIQDLRTEIRQQMHSNQNYTSSLNEAVSKLNEDVMSFVEVTKSITAESIEKISDRIESMENKLSVTNLGEIETTLNKIVDALESLVSIRSVMEDFSPYFESMQKINEKMVSLIKEHYDIINARLSSMDETMLAYINSMNNKIDVPQSEEKIPSLINNIDEIKERLTEHETKIENRLIDIERKIETEDIESKLEKASNVIIERVSKIKESSEETDAVMLEVISNRLKKLEEIVQEEMNKKTDEDSMNKIIEIKNSLDVALDAISNKLETVEETVQEQIDKSADKDASTYIKEIRNSFNAFSSKIEELREEMPKSIESSVSSQNKNIFGIKNELNDLKESVENYQKDSSFKEEISLLNKQVNKIMDEIKNKPDNVESELKRMVFAIEVLQARYKEISNKLENKTTKRTRTARRKTGRRIKRTGTVSASRTNTREALKELADSSILNLLKNTTKMNTTQIINAVPVSKNMAKNRLIVLNNMGRIKRQKQGNSIFYSLS